MLPFNLTIPSSSPDVRHAHSRLSCRRDANAQPRRRPLLYWGPRQRSTSTCADHRHKGARRAPTVPVGLSPDRGGGAGWRAERTARRPGFGASSEQLSFCAKTAASKQRLRQFYRANDDVRRPRGPRRPYAHPTSATTDRARKRASSIYFPPPAHPLLIVAAAAAQQCSAIRSSGIWGGLGHRRRLSSRSPSPAPFVARARGCGALGS